MLFNSIHQLKDLTGFLYAYNSFDNIRTDIELAQEQLADLIGEAIIQVALNHIANPAPDADPVLNALVRHMQLPVAYHAIHSFSQNADVSHEDSGRKVKIDADREKLPWEWMLENDSRAILQKAHRTTDRLIAFLEKNVSHTDFAPWADSPQRTALLSQFIPDALTFDTIYPIAKSRRFFLVIAPFIREAERRHLLPVLSQPLFDAIKGHLAAGTTHLITPPGILPFIRVPLAYLAMAIAVERLNIQVLPEGVFQNFVSDRATQNAKAPATAAAKHEFATALHKHGITELKFLQQFIQKHNQGDGFTPVNPMPPVSNNNKYIRL